MAKVMHLGPIQGRYRPDYQLTAYRNGDPQRRLTGVDLRSVVAIQTAKDLNDSAGTFQITLKDSRARTRVREMDVFRIRLRGHHGGNFTTVMKGVVDTVRPVMQADPYGSSSDTIIEGRCIGKYLMSTSLFLPVWDPAGDLPTALTFGLGDVTKKGSPTYKAGGSSPFDINRYLVRNYVYGGHGVVGTSSIPSSRHWLDYRTRFSRSLGFDIPFLQFNEDTIANAFKTMEVIGFTEAWIDELGRQVYRRPQWDQRVRYILSTDDAISIEAPRTDAQVSTYVEVIPAGDPGIDSAIAQALRAGRAPVPSSYVKAGKGSTQLGKYVDAEYIIDTDSAGKPTAKGKRNHWYRLQQRLGLRPQQISSPLLFTQAQAQAHAEGLLRFYSRFLKAFTVTIPGAPEVRLGYNLRCHGEWDGDQFDRTGYIEQVSHTYVETNDGGQYTTSLTATHGRDARDPFTGKPDPRWGKIALPEFDPNDLAAPGGGGVLAPGNDNSTPGAVGSPLPGKLHMISSVADHMSRPLGNWQSDNAVDLADPKGTSVFALADGTISSSYGFGLSSGGPTVFGYRLHLVTADNVWFYQHMQGFAAGIKPGAKVTRGQKLGEIGDSRDFGKGSIPTHLHIACQHGNPEHLLGID